MGAQFVIPLITTIPGQLIASALWNNEFNNLNTNFIPAGMDSYSDTDTQMQIQTPPFPGSVTSHASNLGGEIERIRYQLSKILGTTYWYNAPAANIAAIVNDIVPIGGSILFPSATPPNSNWLLRNGQAIGRVAYAALFALIGTTFGAGDGSTTFNIPNSTDKMPIGAGNLYTLGAIGGEATHVLTIAEMPVHTHTDSGHTHPITDSGHGHDLLSSNTFGGAQAVALNDVGSRSVGAQNSGTGGYLTNSPVSGLPFVHSSTTGISVNSGTASLQNTGGGGAHNNLPPYLAEYWMIRAL